MKGARSSIDVLEHVVKGVHVEGRGRRNSRILPRPLDRINDAPPRLTRAPRRVKRVKKDDARRVKKADRT